MTSNPPPLFDGLASTNPAPPRRTTDGPAESRTTTPTLVGCRRHGLATFAFSLPGAGLRGRPAYGSPAVAAAGNGVRRRCAGRRGMTPCTCSKQARRPPSRPAPGLARGRPNEPNPGTANQSAANRPCSLRAEWSAPPRFSPPLAGPPGSWVSEPVACLSTPRPGGTPPISAHLAACAPAPRARGITISKTTPSVAPRRATCPPGFRGGPRAAKSVAPPDGGATGSAFVGQRAPRPYGSSPANESPSMPRLVLLAFAATRRQRAEPACSTNTRARQKIPRRLYSAVAPAFDTFRSAARPTASVTRALSLRWLLGGAHAMGGRFAGCRALPGPAGTRPA